MKVYIITGEPFPYGMAAVRRIICFARAIMEGGVDVEVVIYRRTELYNWKTKNNSTSGVFCDVPFNYVPGKTQRSRFRAIRYIDDKLDLFRTESYLKNRIQKGDVLFFCMTGKDNLMNRFIRLAHKKEAFCISDLCELPYGTSKETAKTIRFRNHSLQHVFPLLDGVISISDSLMELAKQYTSPSCIHIKVPILVDYEQFYMKNRMDESGDWYIFHAGTLSQQKDGILGIIEAFALASKELNGNIRFISTGNLCNSRDKDELTKLIDKYDLKDSVSFLGYLSDQELRDYLSKASLTIINKYPTQQNRYCFSTKLGEYMAAAKPVIITNVGEAMNWVEDGKNAYVVEACNNQSLATKIVYACTHKENSRLLGEAGQQMCKNSFDYRQWSIPIVSFLNRL